jgi:hypothetical protein
MGAKRASILVLLSCLAISSPLFAQTTITYQAPTGSVSPALSVKMNLAGGGNATLNPVVGPNCYLGMTCGFPAGYVGTAMSYSLPDGSTATLTNFNGKFFPLGSNNYEISGQASGIDNAGRNVRVDNVQVTMKITCRSGRGGGCSKVYTGGSLTLSVNVEPPADTPTATPPNGTPTPTVTPTPMPALTLAGVRIRPASATSASGFAKLIGSFVVPEDGSFDPSEGITMHAQAMAFHAGHTWDASECQSNGAIIRCMSADKSDRVSIAARDVPVGAWTFMASFRKLDALGPLAGPVRVTLTDESTGVSRSGMIATCLAQDTALVCK